MPERIIKLTTSKVFNVEEGEVKILERLKLGMSNLVYLIQVNNKKYTFRIPGENSTVFVDRHVEKNGLTLVEPYGLCGKTIYFNDETGYKISEYIDGRVLYQNVKDDDYSKVANILHILHNIPMDYINSYDPFETLDYYESLNSAKFEKDYHLIKEKLLEYKDFLNKQKKVLCHNDAQPSNFVYGDAMYLLDYEFVGANDPLYDVACFGNNDIADGVKLLDFYLNRKPNKDEKNRYYLWRTFQNIQWYLVALYKHELKMDEALDMDFSQVALMFLNNAKISISKVK